MLFLVTAIYCSDPAPSTDCTTVSVQARPTLMERPEGWCDGYGPLRVASDVAFGFAAHRAFVVPDSIRCEAVG